MAEVLLAEPVDPQAGPRVVALKRILPHLACDERFVRLFVREADLVRRLRHPNVVTILDVGEVDGTPYLAMEYVPGRDLASLLHSPGLPSKARTGLGAQVVAQVLRALEYVHTFTSEHGRALALVHRDVSPGNILVGFDGVAKLGDFGVARSLEQGGDRTRSGVVKGKLPYAAPECLAGQPFDHRADLFAAGMVLFESVTGAVIGANTDTSAALLPDAPAALGQVCRALLARDPDLRPAATEAADRLDRVADELGMDTPALAALMHRHFGAPVDATESAPTRTSTIGPARSASPRRWLPVAIALAGVAACFTWWHLRSAHVSGPGRSARITDVGFLRPGGAPARAPTISVPAQPGSLESAHEMTPPPAVSPSTAAPPRERASGASKPLIKAKGSVASGIKDSGRSAARDPEDYMADPFAR
jgi:serine/threonine protein kinase